MYCSVLNKIELNFVKRSELLIIKNSHWKFYRNNSSEIIYDIFNNNNIKFQFQLTENEKTDIINFINNLILFSLCDYSIFGKYEKTIIVLACILLVVSNPIQDFFIPQEIIEHNSNVMNNIIKNISFIDKNQVEKCSNEIMTLMKKKDVNDNDDENEEDEEEISISFNSLENFSSVKEAFTEIDDCSFFSSHYSFKENAINDNNNNTDNNNNNNDNSYNTEINSIDIGKKEESFLQKKRKLFNNVKIIKGCVY